MNWTYRQLSNATAAANHHGVLAHVGQVGGFHCEKAMLSICKQTLEAGKKVKVVDGWIHSRCLCYFSNAAVGCHTRSRLPGMAMASPASKQPVKQQPPSVVIQQWPTGLFRWQLKDGNALTNSLKNAPASQQSLPTQTHSAATEAVM